MDIYDLLRVLPLASAATWFVLRALQVYRDRIHPCTETFFLFSCIFAGLYAVWDYLFFTAGDESFARFAGLVSLSTSIVTAMFLLLFTLVYIDRMRRVYWSLSVVTIAILVLVWSFGLEGVMRAPGSGLWLPLFNETVFLIVLVYIAGYSIGGVVELHLPSRLPLEAIPPIVPRIQGIIVCF